MLDSGISSIAVVLKHAAIYSEHEKMVGQLAQELGFKQVSKSLGCVADPEQHASGAMSRLCSLALHLLECKVYLERQARPRQDGIALRAHFLLTSVSCPDPNILHRMTGTASLVESWLPMFARTCLLTKNFPAVLGAVVPGFGRLYAAKQPSFSVLPRQAAA